MDDDPDTMPPDMTPFDFLCQRVADVHWRWKIYKQLYGRGQDHEDRIVLMESFAPSFFGYLGPLMVADVVLRICKICDPESHARKKETRHNLSIRSFCPESSRAMLDTVEPHLTILRLWRHRVIAHDDLVTATGLESLPDIPIKDIESSLASIVATMRQIDPNQIYDDLIANGDGDSLMAALRSARAYRHRCIQSGEPIVR